MNNWMFWFIILMCYFDMNTYKCFVLILNVIMLGLKGY